MIEQNTDSDARRIAIAGGGTGGHLFPGIAIAEEFMARNQRNRILFVGKGNAFEISALAKTGFKHQSITVEGIKKNRFFKQVKSILKIPKGIFESILILNRFKPDMVISVGSYAAGPVAVAAWLLGFKIVIHEQNILPGMTNRILAHLANRIYVSFHNTQSVFNTKKVRFTGNPVRKGILRSEKNQFGKRPSLFTILIIGGSQGAHGINTVMVETMEYIKEKQKFFFVHQTGIQDEQDVKNAYKRNNIACTVQSFFSDMAQRYKQADLIICRAGATTVAEITSIGKGVLFVPYPFAADNHQVGNARSLADSGAAEMILQKDLSGKLLARRLEYYASNPDALARMASRAKQLGRPDAAKVIVDDCYRLLGVQWSP